MQKDRRIGVMGQGHLSSLVPLGTIPDAVNTFATILKIKVLYWCSWFHKEPLTSMEPFHYTKGSL